MKTSRRTLQHTPDMLYALSERLCMLAKECPRAFLDPYKSIMNIVQKEEYPNVKKQTQAEKILLLLRGGHSLTNKSLMVNHKISAPWKRVSELRARGESIESVWKTCPIDGSKYVTYQMGEKAS